MLKRIIRVIWLGLGLVGLWLSRRRLIAWWFGLPPAQYPVGVKRNIEIPMPDGVKLMADHYWPQASGHYPTVLIRTPYGRGLEQGALALNFIFYARCFAERGYHVIIQNVKIFLGKTKCCPLWRPSKSFIMTWLIPRL